MKAVLANGFKIKILKMFQNLHVNDRIEKFGKIEDYGSRTTVRW